MILSKEDRIELQRIIHREREFINKNPFYRNLLCIVSALISDFEKMESILSEMYIVFASGKEVAEVLDSLDKILSADIISKLNFEEESSLIKNLLCIANDVRKLKFALSELNYSKQDIVQ